MLFKMAHYFSETSKCDIEERESVPLMTINKADGATDFFKVFSILVHSAHRSSPEGVRQVLVSCLRWLITSLRRVNVTLRRKQVDF